MFGVWTQQPLVRWIGSAAGTSAATGLFIGHGSAAGSSAATPRHAYARTEVPAEVEGNANQRVAVRWSTRWGQTVRLLRAPSSPEHNSGGSNDRHHLPFSHNSQPSRGPTAGNDTPADRILLWEMTIAWIVITLWPIASHES